MAASYVVAIGICKLPVLNCHHGADECSSTSDSDHGDGELMSSGKPDTRAVLIAGIVSHPDERFF